MGTCRICQQECSQDQQVCINCGYPFPVTPTLDEIPQAFQEVFSQRERWEKDIWQRYERLQQQHTELFRNHQQLQQQEAHDNTQLWQQGEVPLESAVGYDYTRLRDLLAKQKWQEADKETANAILRVAGRNECLLVEDIENFPCEDLRTIDRLWVKSSYGKFGFSIQKEIYQKLGDTRKFDLQIWEKFGNTVGWRDDDGYMEYVEDLNWSNPLKDNIPKGHLPVEAWVQLGMDIRYGSPSSLAQRLVNCNI